LRIEYLISTPPHGVEMELRKIEGSGVEFKKLFMELE
jgi:hypothetical protein